MISFSAGDQNYKKNEDIGTWVCYWRLERLNQSWKWICCFMKNHFYVTQLGKINDVS